MIEVISATRCNQAAFQHTPLGLSLHRLRWDPKLVPTIEFSNDRGLPEVYNARIQAASANDILLFIHDDVWIDDYFLSTRLIEGLEKYQIIGVAGNKRVVSSHVGWAFKNSQREWDHLHLSGAVAHGATPFGGISVYGQVPAPCELMDGVFLAACRSQLVEHQVRFDRRFNFHFYDLDFCRTARAQGMSLGTWPVAITHNSGGSFGSPAWSAALAEYKVKWPE